MVLVLPATGEPYIRLPAPHSHLILTPPRLVSRPDKKEAEDVDSLFPPEADIATSVAALNDPRVFLFLEGTPHPFARENTISWARMGHAETQRIFAAQRQQGGWFDGCPFRNIRDTTVLSPASSTSPDGEDGEDKEIAQASYIGDFMLQHYPYYELPLGSEEREKAKAENAALPAGHDDLIWGIGCMSFSLSFSLII
jgi:hypothetical protein